jgi:hypothetical protein
MLWKVTRQTLIATLLIAILAGAWQVAMRPGGPAGGSRAGAERIEHDD